MQLANILSHENLQARDYLHQENTTKKSSLTQKVADFNKLFNSINHQDYTSLMVEECKNVETLVSDLDEQENPLESITIAQTLTRSLASFINKFQEYASTEILEAARELENQAKDLEVYMVILAPVKILSSQDQEMIFKNFYQSLSCLLAVLESQDINLISQEAIRNVRNVLQYLLNALEGDPSLNHQLFNHDVKPILKAIMWEVEKMKLQPEKRFKTIHELWKYWDEKYTAEEMTETLNLLSSEV